MKEKKSSVVSSVLSDIDLINAETPAKEMPKTTKKSPIQSVI